MSLDLNLANQWVAVVGAAIAALMGFLVPWWGHRREERRYEREARSAPASSHVHEAAGALMGASWLAEGQKLQNEMLQQLAVALDRQQRTEEARDAADKHVRRKLEALVRRLTRLVKALEAKASIVHEPDDS